MSLTFRPSSTLKPRLLHPSACAALPLGGLDGGMSPQTCFTCSFPVSAAEINRPGIIPDCFLQQPTAKPQGTLKALSSEYNQNLTKPLTTTLADSRPEMLFLGLDHCRSTLTGLPASTCPSTVQCRRTD